MGEPHEYHGPQRCKDAVITYLSCGNTDDKLTQREWASLLNEIHRTLLTYSVSWYGNWYSAPESEFQNACFAFSVHDDLRPELQGEMRAIAVEYKQDAIAWADCPATEFLGPEMHTLNHPGSDRWTGGDKKDEK